LFVRGGKNFFVKEKKMQMSNIYRGLSALVASLAILCSAAVRAEEIKPFLTLKITSPARLIRTAEKIGESAGVGDQFKAALAPYKEMDGINSKGTIGVILRSNKEKMIEPILIVPVTSIEKVNIPNLEGYIDTIRSALQKRGDKYIYNSPFGNYVLLQKEKYLVVAPEKIENDLPKDPLAYLDDIKKYTLGFKLQLENTSYEAIETILAPVGMLLSMQGGEQAGQAFEQVQEGVKLLFEQYATLTYGGTIDPETLDAEVEYDFVPRKDSDAEKQIAEIKKGKTLFSGFLDNSAKAVFSMNMVVSYTQTDIDNTLKAIDSAVEGILEQLEENEEDEAKIKVAKEIAESARNVLEASLKKGFDAGASLDSEGVALGAVAVAETAELSKISKSIYDLFRQRAQSDLEEDEIKRFDTFLEKNLKKDVATIEGYKVSSLKIPVKEAATVAEFEKLPESLKNVTAGIFWGVKENEAVAFAAGLDYGLTEKKFKAALAKTKTAVPLKQPIATVAIKPLGELLKKYAPVVEGSEDAKFIDILANADPEAKGTASFGGEGNTLNVKVNVAGKAINTLIEIIKRTAENQQKAALDREEIQDF
jgi:hypothetical protein